MDLYNLKGFHFIWKLYHLLRINSHRFYRDYLFFFQVIINEYNFPIKSFQLIIP